MSGLIRCVAVCALLAVLTSFVSLAIAGDPARSAPGRTQLAALATPRAAAGRLATQLPKGMLLGELQLRVPPPWSTPKLRSVVNVLRSDPKGRQLYTLSGSTEPSADAYAGSFGIARPNDVGEPVTSKVRFTAIHTTLWSGGFSRRVQQERNIALVSTASAQTQVANVAVECDSPGWYVVTFHLSSAGLSDSRVRNTIRRANPATGVYTTELDDTRTVSPGATFALPFLFELREPDVQIVLWDVEPQSGGWVYLVLHAVTVDKIA